MLSALIFAAVAAAPLTLERAIDIALERNLSYRQAHVAVTASQARLRESLAPRLPSLSLQDSYHYANPVAKLSTPFGALPFSTVYATNVPLAALQYTIYDGGLTAARIAQAEAGLSGDRDRERQARGAAIAQVSKAYYDLAAAIALRTVADRAVGVAAAHVKQTGQFFRAGTVAKADVLRAQTDLANERVNQVQAAGNVTSAQLALDDAMNVPLTTHYLPVDRLDAPAPNVNVDSMLASAHAMRGDLAAAQSAVVAANAAVSAAHSTALPNVNVTVADGNTQPAVVGGYHNQFSVGLNAVWTLFDNGYTSGRVAEARAGVEQAKLAAQALQNQIDLQVRQAYTGMTEAQARVAAARQLVTYSAENLRLARIRYTGGVGTALELQDAELSDRSARQQLASAQAALRQSVVQLRFAAGMY